MIYLIPFSVFCSVILLSAALYFYFASARSGIARRLADFFPAGAKAPQLARRVESGTWAEKLRRIGEKVKLSEKEQSRHRKALAAAGLHGDTVYALLGSKILLAVLLPLPYLLFAVAPPPPHAAGQPLVIALVLAITGYLLPSYWLHRKVKSRQLAIFHTLPDVLDLVTLCVEAGLSMDAALLRTAEMPQFERNPLSREISQVTMEVRAGKPRIEALRDMANRTMVDDLRLLTTVLAQTERYGTGLSQALRTFSDELRIRRKQIAEEAAAKTTVKLIFPLVFAIFPALLVVVLGPAVVQITKIFK